MIIQGKEVFVFDNGGRTCDRYTIIIDHSVYAMNSCPFHPAYGFSQYCGELEQGYEWNENWGKEVTDIKDLSDETVQAIIQRFEGAKNENMDREMG